MAHTVVLVHDVSMVWGFILAGQGRDEIMKLTDEAKAHMPLDALAYDSMRIENSGRETRIVYSIGGVDMAYVGAGCLVDFAKGESLTIQGMRGGLRLELTAGAKGICSVPKGTIEDSRYRVDQENE